MKIYIVHIARGEDGNQKYDIQAHTAERVARSAAAKLRKEPSTLAHVVLPPIDIPKTHRGLASAFELGAFMSQHDIYSAIELATKMSGDGGEDDSNQGG